METAPSTCSKTVKQSLRGHPSITSCWVARWSSDPPSPSASSSPHLPQVNLAIHGCRIVLVLRFRCPSGKDERSLRSRHPSKRAKKGHAVTIRKKAGRGGTQSIETSSFKIWSTTVPISNKDLSNNRTLLTFPRGFSKWCLLALYPPVWHLADTIFLLTRRSISLPNLYSTHHESQSCGHQSNFLISFSKRITIV